MADSTAVVPGEVLAGKYRVERVLGEGGMGFVVAAWHLQLDEQVALKFMRPEAAGNADLVARFLREARAAVKLKGPHVARVLDVGTLETGAPYIVMEYLEGDDLGTIVKQYGPLPLELAAELLIQACDALAEAHARGMVHRDIKPPNLFVIRAPDGTPELKVLDFGIAKASLGKSAAWAATQTQTVMGSPLYMSPEQMRSLKDVDARTDIWALGVVLYEILTGALPFEAETMPQLCALILEGAAASLSERRRDLSPEIQQIIDSCLTKDRNQRYQTVAELARALAPYAPRRAQALIERIESLSQRGDPTDITGRIGASRASTPLIVAPVGPPPSISSTSSASSPALTAAPALQATAATWSGTGSAAVARSRARSVPFVVLGLGMALVLFLIVGAVIFNAVRKKASSTEEPVTAAEPTTPVAVPTSSAEPTPVPSAAPSPSASPPPSAVSRPPPVERSAARPTAPVPQQKQGVKSAPTITPKRDTSDLTHR